MIDRSPRRRSRLPGAAIALFMALWIPGCAAGDGSAPDTSEIGAFGRIEFEAEPTAPPAAGENAFHVTLRDLASSEPVTDASLSVSAVMPSMGHTAPEGIHVGEIGGGLYDVEQLVFSMQGVWEVRYRAIKGDLTDEAAFRYEVR